MGEIDDGKGPACCEGLIKNRQGKCIMGLRKLEACDDALGLTCIKGLACSEMAKKCGYPIECRFDKDCHNFMKIDGAIECVRKHEICFGFCKKLPDAYDGTCQVGGKDINEKKKKSLR